MPDSYALVLIRAVERIQETLRGLVLDGPPNAMRSEETPRDPRGECLHIVSFRLGFNAVLESLHRHMGINHPQFPFFKAVWKVI